MGLAGQVGSGKNGSASGLSSMINNCKIVRFRLFAILLLFAVSAWAHHDSTREGDIRFDRLGLDEGLSQSTVLSVAQDSTGFMWFATEDGLNRYDGYQFKVYRHDPANPESLNHNFINALLIDSRGDLWVGSRGGLQIFDPMRDNFRVPGPIDGKASLVDVMALAESRDGVVWAATQRGAVYRFSGAPELIVPESDALGTVHDLHLDRAGRVWISARSGLHIFTRNASGDFRPEQLPGLKAIMAPVYQVLEDGAGRFWVAYADGVMSLSLYARSDQETGFQQQLLLSGESVEGLLQARSGTIWAATGSGLIQFDEHGFRRHRADINDPLSLGGNDVLALFEDASRIMWVGTTGFGLSRYAPHASHFLHLGVKSVPGEGLNNALVWAIERDHHGGLWLGTKGGGLNYRTPAGVFRYFLPGEDASNSLNSDWVLAIHETADGSLWIGTRGGGLSRLEPDSGRITTFRHDPADPTSIANDRIYALIEGAGGVLWLGTNDGLSRFDRETGKSVTIKHQPEVANSLRDSSIRALLLDTENNLWVGTRRGGVHRVDPQTLAVEPVLNELADHLVLSLYRDPGDTLWLATDRGLVSFHIGETRYRVYRRADGLPNDLVYGILPGSDGQLWISTNRGLSRLDGDSGQFINFDTGNGLATNEFNQGAYHVDVDGQLMFGNVQGLTLFHPDDLATDPVAPRTAITDIRISNQSVTSGEGQALVDRPVHLLDRLTLQSGQGIVTLEFASLHYATPERAHYAYRLLGASDEWIETDASRRTATFTGLAPGEYRFQVRAANVDGVWQTDPTELLIDVLPPWWRTGWAFLIYLTVAAGLLLFILRMRASSSQERQQVQNLIAESEERLRLSLWGSGDELWDWDLGTGVVHRMNELENLDRPDIEYFRGVKSLGDYMHPEDREAFEKALQGHLAGRGDNFEATYRCRNKLGGWTWVLDRGQVVSMDAEGQPARLSGTTRVIDELKNTEEALRTLNDQLEERVTERTSALQKANEDLNTTQAQLVESEKMASLGNLVAGVAHELNTPIGIGLTAASHLKSQVDQVMDQFPDEQMHPTLQGFCRHSAESAALIMTSLERAAKMVKSFKQVAVDQAVEEKRVFDLHNYLEQILTSLRPRLRKSLHLVELDCPDNLTLESFPGAFYQIISNLILNSLTHAFEPGQEGIISIEAKADNRRLYLHYRDNGRGMNEEVRSKVFEPFFTTRRGQGGTGLGMHIVFNIVTQILEGTIRCDSTVGAGVSFELRLPEIVVDPETRTASALRHS
jgi:ligand-binding sensor domain-containing protein/signal transduction histidine kinase